MSIFFALMSKHLLEALPGNVKGVGDDAVDGGLKEVKEGKPDARTVPVSLVKCPIIRQRVVVEKETSAYVEGDKDVNRVVLVGSENEEDAKEVEHPGHRVHKVQLCGCVCGNKE